MTQANHSSEQPTLRILRDQKESQQVYLEMINNAKDEILLILPSTNAYLREVDIGVVAALESAASQRQVKVKILTPGPYAGEMTRKFNEHQTAMMKGSRKTPVLIEYKRIQEAGRPGTVTVLVIDRTSSLIVEQQDDSNLDYTKAVGISTFSSRGSTVKSNIRFFERMWEEETLLERERKSRLEAQLLEDILAHDLRNYNQIIQSNAEMLLDTDSGLTNSQKLSLATEILRTVKRSSRLIERAKKLGKIISEESSLSAIDLAASLQRSIELVNKANEGKLIATLDSDTAAHHLVVADDLLDEAFVNILSNSVLHREREKVSVEIKVEDQLAPTRENGDAEVIPSYSKISFIDDGRGIPDELKTKVFTRYLQRSSGSGLGLSIVRALVVDRYSGTVTLKNRIEGDYTKGTIVEVLLRQAES